MGKRVVKIVGGKRASLRSGWTQQQPIAPSGLVTLWMAVLTEGLAESRKRSDALRLQRRGRWQLPELMSPGSDFNGMSLCWHIPQK